MSYLPEVHPVSRVEITPMRFSSDGVTFRPAANVFALRFTTRPGGDWQVRRMVYLTEAAQRELHAGGVSELTLVGLGYRTPAMRALREWPRFIVTNVARQSGELLRFEIPEVMAAKRRLVAQTLAWSFAGAASAWLLSPPLGVALLAVASHRLRDLLQMPPRT